MIVAHRACAMYLQPVQAGLRIVLMRGAHVAEREYSRASRGGSVWRCRKNNCARHVLSLSQSVRSPVRQPLVVAFALLCAHCVVALRGRMFTPYLVRIRFRQRIFRHCKV